MQYPLVTTTVANTAKKLSRCANNILLFFRPLRSSLVLVLSRRASSGTHITNHTHAETKTIKNTQIRRHTRDQNIGQPLSCQVSYMVTDWAFCRNDRSATVFQFCTQITSDNECLRTRAYIICDCTKPLCVGGRQKTY